MRRHLRRTPTAPPGAWWTRAAMTAAAVAVLLAGSTPSALAQAAQPQDPGGSGSPRRRIQPEARADVLRSSGASLLHLGAGAAVPLGNYLRVGAVAALGTAHSTSRGPAGRQTSASARLDALARFVLDPFRERRWGPYALAGISARYVEPHGWSEYVVLGVGLEGPNAGWVTPAVELALGGGPRLGLVVRQAFPGRR